MGIRTCFFCFAFHPSWWKHWHISTHSHCLHPVSFFKARLCLSSFTVEALTYLMHPHLFFCFVFHPSWWKHWHISTHSHCLHPVSFFLACLCLPSFTVEAWTYLLHSHMHSHYRYQYSQNSVSCRVFSVAASPMSSKSR